LYFFFHQVTEVKKIGKKKGNKCNEVGDSYTYLASGETFLLDGAAGTFDAVNKTLSFEWKGTKLSITPEVDGGGALDFVVNSKAGNCTYKMEVQEGTIMGINAPVLEERRHLRG